MLFVVYTFILFIKSQSPQIGASLQIKMIFYLCLNSTDSLNPLKSGPVFRYAKAKTLQRLYIRSQSPQIGASLQIKEQLGHDRQQLRVSIPSNRGQSSDQPENGGLLIKLSVSIPSNRGQSSDSMLCPKLKQRKQSLNPLKSGPVFR